MVTQVVVGNVVFGAQSLVLIAGPCVIESQEMAIETACRIKEMCDNHGIPFVFKSSYRKDARTSIRSYTGPGLERGLEVLASVREEAGVPITSDVHGIQDVEPASGVLDMLQIPAFLCKQTSVLLEAARTNKPINVKKGPFVDPYSMRYTIEKIESVGNRQIILTERGSCFGHYMMVNDFRALPIMRSFGYPVAYDAGHSIRMIGIPSESSVGGHREFIPALTRAAIAAGCDAVFVEVHPDPSSALCDASSQLPLDELENLLVQAIAVHEVVRPYWEPTIAPRADFLALGDGR